MKKQKKFYVGAPHLVNDRANYLKSTMQEAINQAKEQCEESGESQIVVKIVAIVEPAKQPVQVRLFK